MCIRDSELPAACPAVRLVQKTGKAAHRGKVDIVGNAPRRIMFARLQCGGQQHGQLQQPIGAQRRAFRLKFTHGGFEMCIRDRYAHCADYGFILLYPRGKENVTGVTYEPWHYRYVGKDAAKAIMQAGGTLEMCIRDSHYPIVQNIALSNSAFPGGRLFQSGCGGEWLNPYNRRNRGGCIAF